MSIDSITLEQLKALLSEHDSTVSNLSNAVAFLNQNLSNINWIGFYSFNYQTNQLDLGPFQGKVACVHIKNGEGVCGTATAKKEIQNISDVKKFHGHIACDENSKSELVTPLIKDSKVLGVLDIDSPITNRFSDVDQLKIKKAVQIITQVIDK
ncbi:hypothetical protein WR164_06340 [Philodulcilactobacillus myokoensis]|uniref:GAF domain-containing protein n=2 Tax=Philodulcilactobacillus myokoensis TaxID=2929573 RepID=A0A9W6ESD6_9LACO|nr:GAF domain-containing protein [Philodulcilactobacillus myokoensis]GLB46655.1 hypothetical protein WR164_06340 [Philodulcilactobacillus myokoensis]